MSRAGTKLLDIEAKVGEVAAALGYLPPALIGILRVRNFDALDHHRRTVATKSGLKNPDRARRFIFSRMFRYGAKVKNPLRIDQVQGESFLASRDKSAQQAARGFPLDEKFFEALEYGHAVNTREVMAIPILAGLQKGRSATVPTKRFVEGVRNRSFDIVRTKQGKTLLVDVQEARGSMGVRSVVVGTFARRRQQTPLLGFFRAWDMILPRHMAKYERVFDLALTVAGQKSLARQLDQELAKKGEAGRALRRAYASDDNTTKAVKAAAEKAAKRDVSAGT